MGKELKSIAKMDIYSDMRIPLDVAIWARSHKFNVGATKLTRAIQRVNQAQLALSQAQQSMEDAEEQLRAACAEIKVNVEAEHAV